MEKIEEQENKMVFVAIIGKVTRSLSQAKDIASQKPETFTVEGYNSRIRHYLARFNRKGKCYSKSEKMIENSLRVNIFKTQ